MTDLGEPLEDLGLNGEDDYLLYPEMKDRLNPITP